MPIISGTGKLNTAVVAYTWIDDINVNCRTKLFGKDWEGLISIFVKINVLVNVNFKGQSFKSFRIIYTSLTNLSASE